LKLEAPALGPTLGVRKLCASSAFALVPNNSWVLAMAMRSRSK
jgi:hypothetical protein